VYVQLPTHLRERALALADLAAARAIERLEPFVFDTFTAGCQVPPDLAHLPRPVTEAFRQTGRDRLRGLLEEAWPERKNIPENGQVMVEIAPQGGDVKIRITPLYVAGRYQKLVRGLSQTVFHCRACRGRRKKRRCEECKGTGRMVEEAVADFICRPVRAALRARSSSFHGSGREDVDVRMLGNGRPFVVTIDKAKLRVIDGADVERRVAEYSEGRVIVTDVRLVDRATRRRITSEHGEKVYRAVVRPVGDAALPADAVARVAELSGVELAQRTPQRVEESRVDMVRTRRVLSVTAQMDAGDLVLELRTEAGTYVKEFVSGDDGRTAPSVASVLGVQVVCAELDVLGVGEA
jgi:tRNA pseudouridine synthase 10